LQGTIVKNAEHFSFDLPKGKKKRKGCGKIKVSIAQTTSVRTGRPSGRFRLQELPYGVSASVLTGLASCNRKSICALQ